MNVNPGYYPCNPHLNKQFLHPVNVMMLSKLNMATYSPRHSRAAVPVAVRVQCRSTGHDTGIFKYLLLLKIYTVVEYI